MQFLPLPTGLDMRSGGFVAGTRVQLTFTSSDVGVPARERLPALHVRHEAEHDAGAGADGGAAAAAGQRDGGELDVGAGTAGPGHGRRPSWERETATIALSGGYGDGAPAASRKPSLRERLGMQ
jgi:hypothetical protein